MDEAIELQQQGETLKKNMEGGRSTQLMAELCMFQVTICNNLDQILVTTILSERQSESLKSRLFPEHMIKLSFESTLTLTKPNIKSGIEDLAPSFSIIQKARFEPFYDMQVITGNNHIFRIKLVY